jgi:hypothetical protein
VRWPGTGCFAGRVGELRAMCRDRLANGPRRRKACDAQVRIGSRAAPKKNVRRTGSLWDHFSVTLGSLEGHFGIILGSLQGHCGFTLASFLNCQGNSTRVPASAYTQIPLRPRFRLYPNSAWAPLPLIPQFRLDPASAYTPIPLRPRFRLYPNSA